MGTKMLQPISNTLVEVTGFFKELVLVTKINWLAIF